MVAAALPKSVETQVKDGSITEDAKLPTDPAAAEASEIERAVQGKATPS